MKSNVVLVALLAGVTGWCAAMLLPRTADISLASTAAAENKPADYQCPMHPWVTSAKAGDCTICGMKLAAAATFNLANKTPVEARIVRLSQSTLNVVGVQTIPVQKLPLIRTLHVGGVIGEDESRHGIITAPVAGRVDGLAMNCDGEQIHQRQPIANFFSRTLLDEAEDYKRALKIGGGDLEKARQNLERDGLVSEQIAAIPTRQPDDIHFGLIAQLAGTIVKSYVSEGQFVKAGEKLFETADFSRMWFVFSVFEADLPFIHKDQFVEITTASLPGEKLRAKISFINPNLDEATRSAQVRVVLENPDRRIKNKIFAEGMVQTDSEEVLAVPRSAVLWPGNSPRVYVKKTPGTYEQRPVKLGRAGDTAWEVLAGLQAGERVVLAGNLLIDGQAQLEGQSSVAENRQ